MNTALKVLKADDFASDQDIRWCPGCGDYSILAQMKKVLPEIGIPPEQTVFISGIGCSSRFPYYVNTYGVHSIHGRAPAVATGLKLARPELRIYGLTKGQYSPTSVEGQITKSTPMGVVDHPLNPISIAIGAEATFIARSVDSNIKHLATVLKRAAEHRGTSFVEVYQNCNVFNDGAFSYAQDKATRDDATVELEHGKPMIFGKDKDKGIRLKGFSLEVVDLADGKVKEEDLLFHDEQADPALVYLLSRMRHPQFPEPIGVFRNVEHGTFEEAVRGQIEQAVEQRGRGDLQKLLSSGDTWTVKV